MAGKYLIVGLGNPGRDYAQTRHNVGFWVIDELAKRYQITNFKSERKALVADGLIKDKGVILAKPQTYMNLSGESVRSLVDFYKIEPEQVIIIHDDLDLPLGVVRLRKTGSHGGQNGVRNIIQHLGTQEFARARFGIGRPAGKMAATDYVLQGFKGDDGLLAQNVTEKVADAVELWLTDGIELAMSRFNGDITNEPKASPPESALMADLHLAERAHDLNPKDTKPLEAMAQAYKRLRRLDDAARAHLLLAELYREAGNPKAQASEWEMALKIRPALLEVYEELADLYEANDNLKKAVQIWLNLAEYQEWQKNFDAALAAIEKALHLNPQHPKALAMQTALFKKLTL